MNEKLKPYPFGCPDPESRLEIGRENGWYFVRCRLCGTQGPFQRTEDGAMKFWNTRQPIPLHPTVEQWEAATVEKLGDDDPVRVAEYGLDKNEHHIIVAWRTMTYKRAKAERWGTIIVNIIGQGKPKADWGPE